MQLCRNRRVANLLLCLSMSFTGQAWAQIGGTPQFVENQGQWETPVSFIAQSDFATIAVTDSAILLATWSGGLDTPRRRSVMRLSIPGARGIARGLEQSTTRRAYFLGQDSRSWRTGVPSFESVELHSHLGSHVVTVRPSGVHLRHTLLPGTSAIRLDLEGAAFREHHGTAGARNELGTWRLTDATAHSQHLDGSQATRSTTLRIKSEHILEIEVDSPTAPEAVVIEHGLEWSTFFGGPGIDGGRRVALRQDGGVIVGGRTSSAQFPVTPGAFDETYGGGTGSQPSDIFIAHLSPKGNDLIWATYVGGSNTEELFDMLVEADGSIVFVGQARSDYPTTSGAFIEGPAVLVPGFLTRLAADGESLEFSTLFGGTALEKINAVAKHPDGHYVIVGDTFSPDFPTTPGAIVTTPPTFNVTTCFLAMLSSDGADLLYSTLLDVSLPSVSSANADSVVVDDLGRAYVGGYSSNDLFLTTPGAFQTENAGIRDAFVCCIDMEAGVLVASTYFGGGDIDEAHRIGIDPRGSIVVMGKTSGQNGAIPVTSNAFDSAWSGIEDLFIAKFSPDLSTLEYSSYLGGGGWDVGLNMVVESSGALVIAGNTSSNGFPVTKGAFQVTPSELGSSRDMFVLRFAPDGQSLHYATYLGGENNDGLNHVGLAVGDSGAATITAFVSSTDFPTTPDAWQTEVELADAAIVRLTLLPDGVIAYGASTAGCSGPLALGVTSMPAVGANRFSITCTNAPPLSAHGVLAASLGQLDSSIKVGGADAWINPNQLLAFTSMRSDDVGYAELLIPMPANPAFAGLEVFVQAFWHDPCAPDGLSASNALNVRIRP